MPPVLRLIEDILPTGASLDLPAAPRMLYVAHGAVVADGRLCAADEAWQGEGAATLTPGSEGATCWRFELARDDEPMTLGRNGAQSRPKLAALLDTLPEGPLLMRGDSVAFPPGGCAYLHRHQGPGIRCLLDGGVRIDTHGHSTAYGPGGAWYESGPEPVFAQAAADRPSRFVRVMILPLALLGKSSIHYLNEEDRSRPKSQQYKIFVDAPLAWPAG